MTDFPMVELPVEGGFYLISTDLLDDTVCATFEGGRFVVSLEQHTLYLPVDLVSVDRRIK